MVPVFSFSKRPSNLLHLNFAGPFPETKNGNKMLLVVVDHFSRYLYAIPTRTSTTTETIRHLSGLFKDKGCPSSLLTDQGPNFMSNRFIEFMKEHNIKHCHTAPHHPMSDGKAERSVKTVKELIRADLLERLDFTQRTWDERIGQITQAYNHAPHKSTGKAPVLLAEENSWNPALAWLLHERGSANHDPSQTSKNAIENSRMRSRKNREYVNSKRRTRMREYRSGQIVWRRRWGQASDAGKAKSLLPKWDGPFYIAKKVSPVNYEIRQGKDSSSSFAQIVHGNDLMEARDPTICQIPRQRGRPKKERGSV